MKNSFTTVRHVLLAEMAKAVSSVARPRKCYFSPNFLTAWSGEYLTLNDWSRGEQWILFKHWDSGETKFTVLQGTSHFKVICHIAKQTVKQILTKRAEIPATTSGHLWSRATAVNREIKLDVTWSYVKRQTAKMTSEFVFFSSNPSLNHIKIEKCLLPFTTNTNFFTLLFKELKTDGKSFIFAVCRLTLRQA